MTTVVSSLNPSLFGQAVTFTATVVGTAPGSNVAQGTVIFGIDGLASIPITLVNGMAQFTTSALGAGTHTIVAWYSGFTQGSYTLNPSQSGPLTQTVTPSGSQTATTTTLNVAPASPSVFGQSVSLTATVTGFSPGNAVLFLDGAGTILGFAPVSGVAVPC